MDRDRLESRIREISASRKNVRFSELVSLLDKHIAPLFSPYNHHGNPHHAFTVGNQTFNIAEPKRGCVKKVYINQFLDAMQALGLWNPEDNP
jgi:hypothetical protein